MLETRCSSISVGLVLLLTSALPGCGGGNGPSGSNPMFTLTVSKSGTGTGIVVSSPAGINCGADCTEAYSSGSTVTLSATANDGSRFTGFSGNADCIDGSIIVSADTSCAAQFAATTADDGFTLTIGKSGNGSGTITSAPAGIDCGSDCNESYARGTNVTLRATPDAGSQFAGSSGAGDCSDRQVTMTANLQCVYQFALLPPSPPAVSVWLDTTPGHREVLAARTTNGGTSYTTPVDVSRNAGTRASTPQAVVTGDFTIVVWSDLVSGSNSEVFIAVSSDEGRSYKAPVNLSNSASASTNPQIALDGNRLGVVWVEQGSKKEIHSVYSFDTGGSFTAPFVESAGTASTDSVSPSIALSFSTSLVIWQENTAAAQIMSRRSTDLSATTRTAGALLKVSGDSSGFDPQMAMFASDLVIAYVGRPTQPANFPTEIFTVRSGNLGSSYFTPQNISNDATASNDVRLAMSGEVVLATYQATTDDASGKTEIFLARSDNRGALFAPGISLSPNAVQARYQDVALAGATALVSWDDMPFGGSNMNRQVLVRRSADAGATFGAAIGLTASAVSAINTQLALPDAQTAVINWSAPSAGVDDIFSVGSRNAAATLSDVLNVSNNTGASTRPSPAYLRMGSARPCDSNADGRCVD